MKFDFSFLSTNDKTIIYPHVKIHYLNVSLLKKFLNETKNIKHRFFTGVSRKNQVKISKAIKIARELALLPYKH